MNLSYEALKKLEDDVRARDPKAIMFVKSMRGNVNGARKQHGMSPFEVDPDGKIVVREAELD